MSWRSLINRVDEAWHLEFDGFGVLRNWCFKANKGAPFRSLALKGRNVIAF